MSASSMLLSRQGQYLLLIGMILIFYSSFDGFAIPFLSPPRIGLSVHTLSALQAIFLLVQGSRMDDTRNQPPFRRRKRVVSTS